MRILILQMARFGDILQTIPTLHGLKTKYPKAHLTLAVRNTFSDAAQVYPHVDKLVEFPTADILGPFIESPTPGNKKISQEKLASWLTGELVDSKPYDLLINLTFSVASSFLTEIIPAKEKRGIRRSADGGFFMQDSWSQYFYAQVLQKNMNILHLNDLFLRIAGVDETQSKIPLSPEALSVAVTPKNEETKRIGIQITASQPEKTLSIEGWAEIINKISAEIPKTEFVFFGSAQDLTVLEAVKAKLTADTPSLTLAGTLKFHENANWVKSCDAIVAPDTGIIHLASLVQTKVVCISLFGIRSEETGPYGEGHDVLYPASAKIEQFADAVVRALKNEKIASPVAHAKTRLITCANGTQRSALLPENFEIDEAKNFFVQAYYLLAEFRCAGRQEDIEIPKLGDPAHVGSLDLIAHAYDGLCSLRRLAEFGQFHCLEMLEKIDDKLQLQTLMQKLAEVDQLITQVQTNVSLLRPLLDGWSVQKHCIQSNSLPELISLTEGSYRELKQNIEIVQQLLQTAVQAAQDRQQSKIGAVEPSTSKDAVAKPSIEVLREGEIHHDQ